MRLSVALVACLVSAAPSWAGGAGAEEQAVARRVDAGVDGALGLLQRLVDINSGSQNLAGVRAVGDVLRAELDRLGLQTRWIPGAAFGRAGHLVAEKPGKGPRMLLIGHLDTVFEPDSPFQRFEPLGGGKARGPGIIDMKGGDVILLLALRALRDEGLLDGMSVAVIFTGDEEATGTPLEASRASLEALASDAEFAIGFEDGDGDPATAVVARRGSGAWQVTTRGVRAHSSLIGTQDVGSGAVFELSRILAAFHEIREPHLALSTGLVLGGSSVELEAEGTRGTASGKTNVTPEHAVAVGDLRPYTLEQRTAVQDRMRAIVADHLPRTGGEIEFDDSYPPMGPSDGNRRLLALLDQASRDLLLGAVGPAGIGDLGAADVSFAAPHVRGAIDGLGLGGDGGHTVHETADLTALPVQAKRAAVLMLRLSRGAFDPAGTSP